MTNFNVKPRHFRAAVIAERPAHKSSYVANERGHREVSDLLGKRLRGNQSGRTS